MVPTLSHLGAAHVSVRGPQPLRSRRPGLKPTAHVLWEPEVLLEFLWILVWGQRWLTLYKYIWFLIFSASCGRNMVLQTVCVVFFLRIWWFQREHVHV